MDRRTTLISHCRKLIRAHRSIRQAAAHIKIDHGYLHRLSTGDSSNPSEAVLRKLGLYSVTKTVYYRRITNGLA